MIRNILSIFLSTYNLFVNVKLQDVLTGMAAITIKLDKNIMSTRSIYG